MQKLMCCCVIFLVGCTPNVQDLVEYTDKVKANTQVSIEQYPKFHEVAGADYLAADLRSPFHAVRAKVLQVKVGERGNCPQPNHQRTKHALEHYGIDSLRMAGVFANDNITYALIKANDGSLHKAKVGHYIGLFHGKITAIKDGELVIKEMLPDGAGCWKSKTATLTVNGLAGENNV